MDPELRDIHSHIKEVGLGTLAQAQANLLFDMWHGWPTTISNRIFGVIQAAQAAELLFKACVAQNHPLLIFSQLPRVRDKLLLDFDSLVADGRTVEYKNLPELVWAVTGYKINDRERYDSFGRLRNTIQHFATPDVDLRLLGTEFIYRVIDPMLEHFWGENALAHCDAIDHEDYICETLRDLGVTYRPLAGY